MAIKLQAVRKRARFAVVGFNADEMREVGFSHIEHMFQRWDSGLDAFDQPAPPLKSGKSKHGREIGYKVRKVKRGGRPIRDLLLTGKMRAGIKVSRSQKNRVVIAPQDEHSARRINENNKKSKQWGVSPRDRENISRVLGRARFVRVMDQRGNG